METAGTVHLAADAMHLLAAGFWPAGLHPFLLFLASVRRDFRESHEPHLFDIAAVATRRFSAMSLAIVPAVALTGITNSVYLVGSFAALTGTPYGRILLLKLSLFSGMICLGGWNLLFLKPRLLPIPQNPHRIKLRERSLDALRKSVVAELCLGAAVIIVVGVLGITEPAMH
jgi:putative copper resistance protein D